MRFALGSAGQPQLFVLVVPSCPVLILAYLHKRSAGQFAKFLHVWSCARMGTPHFKMLQIPETSSKNCHRPWIAACHRGRTELSCEFMNLPKLKSEMTLVWCIAFVFSRQPFPTGYVHCRNCLCSYNYSMFFQCMMTFVRCFIRSSSRLARKFERRWNKQTLTIWGIGIDVPEPAAVAKVLVIVRQPIPQKESKRI